MSTAEAGPRLVVGEESVRRDADHARDLLLALSQLIQVARFHDLGNVALDDPLDSVSRITATMCSGGRRIHMLVDEEQVFVNRRRVRLSTGAFRAVRELILMLERRGLAGLEVTEPASPDVLRGFLRAFHGVPAEAEDPADVFDAALREEGVTTIALVRPGADTKAKPASIELDEGELAALLYAKAVVILRESFRCWEDEELRSYLGARAKRVVQQMITLAERSPRPFLWLVNVKDAEEYLYTHSANVALLSILVGNRLGLDRNRVCELGMAALFHDMGRIGLPAELLTETKLFTSEQRTQMASHPIHGVNLLLQLGTLNESLLERLIVVFEHNIDSNGYPRSSWPHDLHLFSRIVAVADAFDAMTTRRRYRPALTPDETMRELSRHAGDRYDADLVKVFTDVMGIYPLGTLVRLDTGEGGLVFHVDPATPRRPLVKLVWDAEESRLEDGEVVDLGETDEEGGHRRSIVGTDDPIRHGIHVPAFLTGEAP